MAATAARFIPDCTISSAATPKCTAPPCSAFVNATLASCGTRTGSLPAWPLGYDVFEPYYTQAEALYHVHGQRGEDPTEPWSSAPYAYPPVKHEPRIQESERHPATRGAAPVPSAAGHQAGPEPGRQRHHLQPLHPLRCVRWLPLRDQREGRRPSDLRGPHPRGVSQLHVADERLRHPLGDRRRRPQRQPRARDPRQRGSSSIRPTSWSPPAERLSSALLLLRSRSDAHPKGLANGSDQVGRNYIRHNMSDRDGAAEGAEPHGVPEDAGRERLLLRRR